MGEATKAEAPLWLAWLIGGDRWYVVRDASEGDVDVLGWVGDGDAYYCLNLGTTHVKKWRPCLPGEKTRPFAIQRRIDCAHFVEAKAAPQTPAQQERAGGLDYTSFMVGTAAVWLLVLFTLIVTHATGLLSLVIHLPK